MKRYTFLKNGIHEKFLLHTISIAKNSDPPGAQKGKRTVNVLKLRTLVAGIHKMAEK